MSYTEEKKIEVLEDEIGLVDKSLAALYENSKENVETMLEKSLNEKKTKHELEKEELNKELGYLRQVKGYNQRYLDNLKKNLIDKKDQGKSVKVRTGRTPVRMPSKYLSSEKLRKITRSKSPFSSSLGSNKAETNRIIV